MLYRILGWKMLHVYTLIHFRENINKWIGEIVIRFVVCCAVLHISAMFSRLMKFLAQADQSIRFCDVFFGDGTKQTNRTRILNMHAENRNEMKRSRHH